MMTQRERQQRDEAIERAIMAGLMHHKPDYGGPSQLDKSAMILSRFVISELDAIGANG